MFSETRLNVHCVELRVTRKTLLYLQHVEPQHSGDEVGNVLFENCHERLGVAFKAVEKHSAR